MYFRIWSSEVIQLARHGPKQCTFGLSCFGFQPQLSLSSFAEDYFRLNAWLVAYLLKFFTTRPAAFPGLGDSDSRITLDLIGAKTGRCCPYLVLPDISFLLAPSRGLRTALDEQVISEENRQ